MKPFDRLRAGLGEMRALPTYVANTRAGGVFV